jgi:hypothetical protein
MLKILKEKNHAKKKSQSKLLPLLDIPLHTSNPPKQE